MEHATTAQFLGALGFGIIIGWDLHYINRYRKAEVKLGDLVTLVGVLGGGTVVTLFPARSDLFGAYGIGLFAGFFGYLVVLSLTVWASQNFDKDFFLDGRRKKPTGEFYIPSASEQAPQTPMGRDETGIINP